ncbi:MAG: hypothetical protein ACXABO_02930 [Promethearchaeota archaeon]|jgi:hypothetical protein
MKDPRLVFRKGIMIAILLLSLGVAQLVFVISTRSQLVWRYRPGPRSGDEIVTIPPNLLYPNRYVLTVMGFFPSILYDDVIGNITFSHLSSGKNFTHDYRIVGYLMYEKMILDVKLIGLNPGRYNISWDNNDRRFEYMFTTHGLFNLVPNIDRFPYISETVFMLISIFGFIAFLVASIKKYLKERRNYAYHV